jgi:nitrite reductase/ring-hydroxylating ferredoxin subunit
VVVATLLPTFDRGAWFARAFATRSYVVLARIAGEPPPAMLITAGSPTRSIRAVKDGADELLMVGGEGHKAGATDARPERYERLEEFARNHWEVEAVDYRWSSQDYTSADNVPFIGPINPLARDVYVATGFGKWGMTSGTLAGMVIADAIRGAESEWNDLVWSLRFRPRGEIPSLVSENTRTGVLLVGDRVRYPGRRSSDSLAPGEGGIVSHQGNKVAGYRDDEGKLHAVSARCTHLGCQVRWNAAERTWDCPCHASRFGVDGEVLEGPATKPLGPR